MGASLGPVLANIIMTECEKLVLPKLLKKGKIKFYVRYVDDTLLLVEKSKVKEIQNAFNSFDKNLKFTVDDFQNSNPHFLDLEICPNGLKIFRKDTHTGQYVNIDSCTTWKWKTAWIRSLSDRAFKLCSKSNLSEELKCIRNFAAWNGYPSKVVNAIIKRASRKTKQTQAKEDQRPTVFFHVNYAGTHGENLIKKCFKKLNRFTKENVNFVTRYTVTKLSYHTNMKDKVEPLSKSSIVYQFICPGCNSSYIGKTDRTFFVRTREHATRQDTAVRAHVDTCDNCCYLFSLSNMFNNDVNASDCRINLVRDNTKIIDSPNN